MKAIVSIGYKHYVMDAEKAITMLGVLEHAEVYEQKWDKGVTSHFVYAQDTSDHIREVKLLPDALYKLAKLAGKPNKD